MKKALSYQAAIGAMNILCGQEAASSAAALNCTEDEWKMLTGSKNWVPMERPVIMRLLDSLLYGTLDACGVDRFPVPAEYVAAVLSVFCAPTNIMIGSKWLGTQVAAEDLANYTGADKSVEGMERVTPHQIFAMCVQIKSGNEIDRLVKNFNQKCKRHAAHTLKTEAKK